MSQLKTKFIEDNAISGAKFRLANNQNLRARNAAGSGDVDIVKLNASDRIEFASMPQHSGTPAAGADIINLSFLQSYIDGVRDPKQACRAASVADVNIASAPAAIGGVTLASGDRVLLKDQSAGAENGIYVFNGAASAMTRSSDADASAEVTQGMSTLIAEGTNERKYFMLTTVDPITLGTTALVFAEVPNATVYVGHDMVTISGSNISVDLATSSGLESTNAGNAAGQLRVKASGDVAVKDRTVKLNASNEVQGLKCRKENFTLGAGDITNQYIDLAYVAAESSIEFNVDGAGAEQREGVDYTINYTGGAGGKTRLTFAGDLATAGAAELVATDVVRVGYKTIEL